MSPDWCGLVGCALFRKLKAHRFYSQSQHMPELRVRSLVVGLQLWACERQQIRCFFLSLIFLSLSLSLPSTLSIKKKSGWGCLKRGNLERLCEMTFKLRLEGWIDSNEGMRLESSSIPGRKVSKHKGPRVGSSGNGGQVSQDEAEELGKGLTMQSCEWWSGSGFHSKCNGKLPNHWRVYIGEWHELVYDVKRSLFWKSTVQVWEPRQGMSVGKI